jgi:hypothetical protein
VLGAVALAGTTGSASSEPARAAVVSRFQSAVTAGAVPPDLLARLRQSPHAYFRFVNRQWTQAVCDEYRTEIARLPQVRLHGDAHVEQYAVTADARGLDDFDDSALGPAVVDIVRFLGSLELVARQAGWQRQSRAFTDAFFRGYERALTNSSYAPVEPAIVARLRARPVRSQEEFLAWAESLMSIGPPDTMRMLESAVKTFQRFALEQVPTLTEPEIAVKKYGVLQMGIGSALARKVLMRVEGPTSAPGDDVIVEAKELARLDSASCVSIPPPVEAFRVVTAASQLGRLHHSFLVVVPHPSRDRPDSPGWWVRSWDRTYRELELPDVTTPRDLQQIAEDAGAQLGAANTRQDEGVDTQAIRRQEISSVRRLRAKIRRSAARLATEVVEAWQVLNQARASEAVRPYR